MTTTSRRTRARAAWSRRAPGRGVPGKHGGRDRGRRRTWLRWSGPAVAGLLVLALVASAVVVSGATVSGPPPAGTAQGRRPPMISEGADVVLAYVHTMPALADPDARALFVRRTVLPSRAVAFLDLEDTASRSAQRRWSRVRVTPLSYRVVERGTVDMKVLVLSRVVRTPRAGGPAVRSYEVSGYGSLRQWNRWWIYLDLGTTTRYRPGDQALRDFVEAPPPLGS